mmetsp:Transcript_20969/g.66177  ORF Transcript_20969/g.66177 Transcript_20969/m.66177 type:complete len:338 (+) Transcript_20969:315-1328(+)
MLYWHARRSQMRMEWSAEALATRSSPSTAMLQTLSPWPASVVVHSPLRRSQTFRDRSPEPLMARSGPRTAALKTAAPWPSRRMVQRPASQSQMPTVRSSEPLRRRPALSSVMVYMTPPPSFLSCERRLWLSTSHRPMVPSAEQLASRPDSRATTEQTGPAWPVSVAWQLWPLKPMSSQTLMVWSAEALARRSGPRAATLETQSEWPSRVARQMPESNASWGPCSTPMPSVASSVASSAASSVVSPATGFLYAGAWTAAAVPVAQSSDSSSWITSVASHRRRASGSCRARRSFSMVLRRPCFAKTSVQCATSASSSRAACRAEPPEVLRCRSSGRCRA